MKVQITGAGGFVGQNLVKYLEDRNCKTQALSLRNSEWKNNFDFRSDVLVHLAGKAHDHKGEATEKDFFDINYELTKEVFDYFLKSDSKLFIHMSSIAAIEEESFEGILSENDISNPKSPYGKSKRKAEDFLLSQKLPEDKKLIILRPTMIHGPGDKGNLSLLFKIIEKRIPYPLGAFQNQRSFVGIDNLCFVIEKIIKLGSEAKSGIYNIADDEALSTIEIIKAIGAVTEKKTSILFINKNAIKLVAKIGTFFKLPLNTKRLNKMTSNLEVSNNKIKEMLHIEKMPFTASEGLQKTIKSFIK